MMLSVDGIQFVTETAPPTQESMLPPFNAYLSGNDELLFSLIYDANNRRLTVDDVTKLRHDEEITQRQRIVGKVVTEAALLFSKKDYAGFIRKLAPFEPMLGTMDLKKLSIARKKQDEQGGS